MAENNQNSIQGETVNLFTPAVPDFSSVSPDVGMLQILTMNLGKYVDCEFFVGTDIRETKTGQLHYVGKDYVVLYDDAEQRFMVCDAHSLKFVTVGIAEQQPAQEQRISENSGQSNTEPQGNGVRERQQSVLPPGNSVAPLRPLTGIRAVSEPSQVKAAFNYTKRKTRS